MIVNFANCDYSNKHTTKSINTIDSIDCIIIEPFNIETPQIKVNRNNKLQFNYCYFTINGKTYYYYIVDRTINKNDIILTLQEDYLHTWETDILSSIAHITRSNQGNLYLVDNLAKKLENPKVIYKNLGTGLTSGISYIMIKGK